MFFSRDPPIVKPDFPYAGPIPFPYFQWDSGLRVLLGMGCPTSWGEFWSKFPPEDAEQFCHSESIHRFPAHQVSNIYARRKSARIMLLPQKLQEARLRAEDVFCSLSFYDVQSLGDYKEWQTFTTTWKTDFLSKSQPGNFHNFIACQFEVFKHKSLVFRLNC